MSKKYITINGKEFPITLREFEEMIKILKSSFLHAKEGIQSQEDQEKLSNLIKKLENE